MAGARILAVDDDAFARKLYMDLLSGEGYVVVTAESGEEGLRLFAEKPFDIVITDIAMKGMDGIQTMEAIKQINPSQDVIVVTGVRDVQTAVNAMKKDSTDFILKPIDPDKFLQIIRNTLEKQDLPSGSGGIVSERLEYLGIQSVYERCLKIISVIEMERVLDLILDSIMAETNAQGGVLWLFSPEDEDLMTLATARGAVNLASEKESIKISSHGSLDMIKAGRPFYDTRGENEVHENAFFIPLGLENRVLGLVKVSDKLDRDRFEARDLMIAKTIGGFASIAVGNAWKVKEIEFKGLKDRKTNTYHISYFSDYVVREIIKAGRYQRTFSILLLKIENYDLLKGEYNDWVLSEAVQGLINAVQTVIRDADILAMSSSSEYYILLPETDYFGSLMSIRRINNTIRDKAVISEAGKRHDMEIGLRSASFPRDGTDLKSLLDSVRMRLEETKKSLYARQRLGGLCFWEMFDMLVGKEEDYPTALVDGKLPMNISRGLEDDEGMVRFILFAPNVLTQVQEIILGEIESTSESRGILYLGAREMTPFLNFLGNHAKVENSATKVFLVGEKGGNGWEMPNLTPVFIDGRDIEKVRFLIFLSVDYAYALLVRERADGTCYGMHISDPIIVENMIAKLQENYHLQVQL